MRKKVVLLLPLSWTLLTSEEGMRACFLSGPGKALRRPIRFLLSLNSSIDQPSLRRPLSGASSGEASSMALPEDLVEEFLLRLPPSEHASLVRAALVCKPWCRRISSPRFCRRFREFHRTPPMLGFICNTGEGFGPFVAQFIPTCSFRPPHAIYRGWSAHDARHGYVLLSSSRSRSSSVARPHLFVVWNSMTDERLQLPPLVLPPFNWNATVLCADSGAGHRLDCLHGTFLVVVVSTDFSHTTFRVYSSVSGSWSQQTLVLECDADEVALPALVGNTIYFSTDFSSKILSYDLATRETSLIWLPDQSAEGDTALMTMEDGGLGIARLERGRLSLWSMETSSNGDIEWAQITVIELQKLLQVKALPISSTFIVFAPGTGVLFVHANDGLFTIDLKSDKVKKVLDKDKNHIVSIVPCMSFYSPAIGSTTTDEGPGVDASSA